MVKYKTGILFPVAKFSLLGCEVFDSCVFFLGIRTEIFYRFEKFCYGPYGIFFNNLP